MLELSDKIICTLVMSIINILITIYFIKKWHWAKYIVAPKLEYKAGFTPTGTAYIHLAIVQNLLYVWVLYGI